MVEIVIICILMLLLLLFMLFDVHYFVRGFRLTVQFWLRFKLKGRKYRDIMEGVVLEGHCGTNDMDFAWHMNNARFLRDCDFGRYQLWMENGIWDTMKTLGAYVTLAATSVRYRRSLRLGDKYRIRTRILCWDEKAFYVEQRVESTKDNFVCVIVIIKQQFLKTTPEKVLYKLSGRRVQSPDFPEEVQKWIESNALSSARLRGVS